MQTIPLIELAESPLDPHKALTHTVLLLCIVLICACRPDVFFATVAVENGRLVFGGLRQVSQSSYYQRPEYFLSELKVCEVASFGGRCQDVVWQLTPQHLKSPILPGRVVYGEVPTDMNQSQTARPLTAGVLYRMDAGLDVGVPITVTFMVQTDENGQITNAARMPMTE